MKILGMNRSTPVLFDYCASIIIYKQEENLNSTYKIFFLIGQPDTFIAVFFVSRVTINMFSTTIL